MMTAGIVPKKEAALLQGNPSFFTVTPLFLFTESALSKILSDSELSESVPRKIISGASQPTRSKRLCARNENPSQRRWIASRSVVFPVPFFPQTTVNPSSNSKCPFCRLRKETRDSDRIMKGYRPVFRIPPRIRLRSSSSNDSIGKPCFFAICSEWGSRTAPCNVERIM